MEEAVKCVVYLIFLWTLSDAVQDPRDGDRDAELQREVEAYLRGLGRLDAPRDVDMEDLLREVGGAPLFPYPLARGPPPAREVVAEEHLLERVPGRDRGGGGPTSSSSELASLHETLKIVTDDELRGRTGRPATTPLRRQQTDGVEKEKESFSDVYFVAIVAGCCAAGIFGVIAAGFCFYKLQKSSKAAADVDYPAYGVTGPSKEAPSPNGDRKLAQSAQMYHYQHQKQQMIAVEKAGSAKNASASDVDSEEENEEGDYTVYECPGLAPTEEMEVKNPLFHDDSTRVSPPANQHHEN